MRQIVLVEDDSSLGETLRERLGEEGYGVTLARTVAEGEGAALATSPDLLVVDVGLPDGSGVELVRRVLTRKLVPVIFLTAMATAEDRLAGYEAGAVDYIPKPFHIKELLLRVARVLESTRPDRRVDAGGILIDLDSMSLRLPDGTIEYPQTRDFQVLQLLIEAAPRVVSRQEILDRFWNTDRLSTHRTVDNSVVRLRHHLREAGSEFIRSVRGVGYQWVKPE